MRALEPEVVDAVWQAIEALLPPIRATPKSRLNDRRGKLWPGWPERPVSLTPTRTRWQSTTVPVRAKGRPRCRVNWYSEAAGRMGLWVVGGG
jgi:hypothetical protein